jgi:hypothetical protein
MGQLHGIVTAYMLAIDEYRGDSRLTRHFVESLLNGTPLFQMIQFMCLNIVGPR